MNILQRAAAFAAVALMALPATASADLYYYAPNTTSGAFNYGSSLSNYIPASAQPYIAYGQQMAQQYESQYLPQQYSYGYQQYPSYNTGYSYPTQYQYQSQSQYQSSYPYGQTSYSYPTSNYGYSYGYQPTTYSSGYGQMNQYGEYTSEPQSYSYPSGTTGPFGEQMCYWSDSSTYEPCGQDPQQWIQDPYTGNWY